MTFAEVFARDMAHIITGTNSEFAVTVDYWVAAADTENDDPDATVKGLRFESAGDRRDDSDGMNAKRDISVMIERAELASIEPRGWLRIDSTIYSIRQVSGADAATWKVKACVDESFEYGRGDAMYGG